MTKVIVLRVISVIFIILAVLSVIAAVTAKNSPGSVLDLTNIARGVFLGIAVLCVIISTVTWRLGKKKGQQ